MDRRDFITNSLVAATGLALTGATPLSAEPVKAQNRKPLTALLFQTALCFLPESSALFCAAAFALGAEGVYCGTVFIASEECPAAQITKDRQSATQSRPQHLFFITIPLTPPSWPRPSQKTESAQRETPPSRPCPPPEANGRAQRRRSPALRPKRRPW